MQNGHPDLLVVRSKQSVKLLEILSEHGFIISTGQGDLKHLTTRHESRQLCQTLLARATNTNQQGISLHKQPSHEGSEIGQLQGGGAADDAAVG